QPHQFGIDLFFFREIAVVNPHFIAGIALDAVQHFEAAAATGAFNGIVGIRDLLEFFEHKSGDNEQALDEIGFDKVGDAAINNDAGIQQEQVVRFVLRGKPDVRDDQGKIFLVAAHGQDHADVTEPEKQAKANEPTGR